MYLTYIHSEIDSTSICSLRRRKLRSRGNEHFIVTLRFFGSRGNEHFIVILRFFGFGDTVARCAIDCRRKNETKMRGYGGNIQDMAHTGECLINK